MVLADGAAAGAGAGGPPAQPNGADAILQMAQLVVPMLLIFWLLVWRPEGKRRKEREALLTGMKPKDKVVTIGGLHGTIASLEKDEVVLLVDANKGVKMRFRRSSIDTIEPSKDGSSSDSLEKVDEKK